MIAVIIPAKPVTAPASFQQLPAAKELAQFQGASVVLVSGSLTDEEKVLLQHQLLGGQGGRITDFNPASVSWNQTAEIKNAELNREGAGPCLFVG